jgi:hypothetical protein
MSGNDQNWHRRHAIQIVAQLPEGTQDALMVLELARELVEGFLQRDQRPALAEVVGFPAPATAFMASANSN